MSISLAWFLEQLHQNQRCLLKMLLSKAYHRPIILESSAWDPKISILKAHAKFAVSNLSIYYMACNLTFTFIVTLLL